MAGPGYLDSGKGKSKYLRVRSNQKLNWSYCLFPTRFVPRKPKRRFKWWQKNDDLKKTNSGIFCFGIFCLLYQSRLSEITYVFWLWPFFCSNPFVLIREIECVCIPLRWHICMFMLSTPHAIIWENLSAFYRKF